MIPRFDRASWIALVVVTAAAYVIFVWGYDFPAVPFWDERYYIVDAQKYINGIYFIDLHPPLGKLLIALGEWLFGRNAETNHFLSVTYYAENIPPGFSFVGFRFFPVLLAWLTAPMFFLLFRSIVCDPVLAAMLCGLYLFDNALVVHLRGALLEGPLLFFAVTLLFTFVALVRLNADTTARLKAAPPYDRGPHDQSPSDQKPVRRLALLMGLALGCVVTTKSLGVVFVLLPLAAAWHLRGTPRAAWRFLTTVAVTSALVAVAVWEVHFTLAHKINPALMENGFYVKPSEGARTYLERSGRLPILALPSLVRDAVRYASWYDAARPPIDFCKPDEKASPFWMWPIGARAVAYWWDSTDNGRSFRYLYLQVNPVVWFTALGAVVVAVSLLLASALAPPARPLEHRFAIGVVVALYFAYFLPFPWIHGVMFLYHYFIPLILSFVLLALVVDEVDHVGPWPVTTAHKRRAAAVWLVAAVASFWFYKPLTYYERPLTPEDLQRRALISLWDLRCVTCPHNDGLCTSVPK